MKVRERKKRRVFHSPFFSKGSDRVSSVLESYLCKEYSYLSCGGRSSRLTKKTTDYRVYRLKHNPFDHKL